MPRRGSESGHHMHIAPQHYQYRGHCAICYRERPLYLSVGNEYLCYNCLKGHNVQKVERIGIVEPLVIESDEPDEEPDLRGLRPSDHSMVMHRFYDVCRFTQPQRQLAQWETVENMDACVPGCDNIAPVAQWKVTTPGSEWMIYKWHERNEYYDKYLEG